MECITSYITYNNCAAITGKAIREFLSSDLSGFPSIEQVPLITIIQMISITKCAAESAGASLVRLVKSFPVADKKVLRI